MNMQKLVQQPVEMDMTPMIDCVFLLMIFFVLVIDLSQKNLEDLVLPCAVSREPDDQPADHRPILNVLQDGTVIHNSRVVFDPRVHGTDYSPVLELLRTCQKSRRSQPSAVDDAVLIRADKWTEWRFIDELMQQCQKPDLNFRKVELALSAEDREAAGPAGSRRK